MPPRSATRKVSGKRKKSSDVAATGESEATAVDNPELPASAAKTEGESTDAVAVRHEENKTEQLVEAEGPNPNFVGNDGDSINSVVPVVDKGVSAELRIKEENSEVDGTVGQGKEDCVSVSENLNEGGVGKSEDGAVCTEASKLATVAAHEGTEATAGDLMILNDNNTPLVVKDDDDGGEETAEVISDVEVFDSKATGEDDTVQEVHCEDDTAQGAAQTASVKSPSENNTTLPDYTKASGEKNTGLADSTKTPCENKASLADSTKPPCDGNSALAVIDDSNEIVDYEDSDNDSEGDDAVSEGDEDPSLTVQDSLTDKKKDKDIEIYVGRLDKKIVEEDLIEVFQKYGELKSARIVRNPTTKKSKGFAFIQFASAQQAKHALSELKDGVEVRGKHVKISVSQNNDTLYLGNICKTWTKEEVLQQLNHYGIEHIEEIRLRDDPKDNGKTKGFAFLEFSTHSNAMAAFQRLQKPDAVFGCDRTAKVAFTHSPLHPGEEALSQVTRVFLEGLTKDWNGEKVKEMCKQYGEIVKIDLRTKRSDYGFVTFTSHESALACVEGINNGIGGEVKIKACMSKPQHKTGLQKQGFRGGFKVEKQSEASLKKEAESSKEAGSMKKKGDLKSQQAKRIGGVSKHKNKGGNAKSKGAQSSLDSQQAKRKRKASSGQMLNAPLELAGVQGSSKKAKTGTEGQNSKTTPKTGNRKGKKALKNEGRESGGIRGIRNRKQFKKQKGNIQGRDRDDSRNQRRDTNSRRGRDDFRSSTRQREDPYAPKYAAPSGYHLGPTSVPASTRRYVEMEPHAGYLEPTSGRQGRSYSGYVEPVVHTHGQHHTIYVEPAAGSQSQLRSRYVERSVMAQSSHRGYIEAAPVGTQVQSYGGHRQPAIVHIAHDPYSRGLARTVRHDVRGPSGSAHIGGRSLMASQVPSHASYTSYQGGGSYMQSSSGTYGSRRSYY